MSKLETKTRRVFATGIIVEEENSCFNKKDELLLKKKKPKPTLWEVFRQKHFNEFGKYPKKTLDFRNKKGSPGKVVVSIAVAFARYTFSGTGFTETEAAKEAIDRAFKKWPFKKSKKDRKIRKAVHNRLKRVVRFLKTT